MRIRIFFCTLSVLTLACLATPAQAQLAVTGDTVEDHHVEAGIVFWKPDPELVLRTGSGGTDVDLINVFGVESKNFNEFRVTLKPGRKHKIRFQYVPMEYDKNAVLTQTFTFGGRTYTVNAAASMDFEWTLMRFGYEWDAVSTDRGFFGIIAELKHNKITADLTSAALNVSSSTDTTAPLPAFGGIGRVYVAPSVSLTAEVTGFKLPESDDMRGKFVDFDIYGTFSLGKHVGVQGGYRSLDVDYLVDDDAGELKMKGPYFGALVRF